MLIDKDRTFIQASVDSEAELESVIIKNPEYMAIVIRACR
jgi:hypothetical protein